MGLYATNCVISKKKMEYFICTLERIFENFMLILSFILVCAKLLQSCPNLCDPMDNSPPGSYARIVEWVSTPSSRGSFLPRYQTPICMSPALSGWEALFFPFLLCMETSRHSAENEGETGPGAYAFLNVCW